MKCNQALPILILWAIACLGCSQGKNDRLAAQEPSTFLQSDTMLMDSIQLPETFNKEDSPANDYLSEQLKPIRKNFKRINSIATWTVVDSRELSGSTEGGEAKYYYQGKDLQKITARHYGESFQTLTEYYLSKGRLSFVFKRLYKYNRPLYYDTAAMKENGDTEAFDFKKSEIIEQRSYFEESKLLHQICSDDCGAPFDEMYLQKEGKEIIRDFQGLVELLNHR